MHTFIFPSRLATWNMQVKGFLTSMAVSELILAMCVCSSFSHLKSTF